MAIRPLFPSTSKSLKYYNKLSVLALRGCSATDLILIYTLNERKSITKLKAYNNRIK